MLIVFSNYTSHVFITPEYLKYFYNSIQHTALSCHSKVWEKARYTSDIYGEMPEAG
jgi:hypothetical protein